MRNCLGFGHVVPRCPSAVPVCLLCSLNHSRSNHQCPNPTCPCRRNLKATPGSCSCLPPCCANCAGDHTALFEDCRSRLAPQTVTRPAPHPKNLHPPPGGQQMDTATDDDNPSPPPSPTRSLRSAFERETPRPRRTTMIQARSRCPHSTGAPPPARPLVPNPTPIRTRAWPDNAPQPATTGAGAGLYTPTRTLYTCSTQLLRELGCVSFLVWHGFPTGHHALDCRPPGPTGLEGPASFFLVIHLFLATLREFREDPAVLFMFLVPFCPPLLCCLSFLEEMM